MTEDTDLEIEQRRERSPAFPYLELSSALDLARKLFIAAKQSEVRLAEISSAWNTTPTSGSLMRYTAALQSYGLVDSSGSAASRKIKLSDAARRILLDTRPGVKEQLCAEAALKPRIMAEIFAQWGDDRPEDSIARSQLQFDYKFTADAARRFLAVYDANLEYLRGRFSDAATLDEPAPDKSRANPNVNLVDANDNLASGDDFLNQKPHTNARRDVFTLAEGDVILIMPNNISEDSFADFSDWLDLIRRKIERRTMKD